MRIEQAIHGYSDGHRLLAASTDLPREARHATHGLSDLSGQYVVAGFEEYLTGYPVPGTNLFAFAKTWYADEMERPGCVWTHTLLITRGDLGFIPSPKSLSSLFRRPSGARTWGGYESALHFIPSDVDRTLGLGPPEAAASLINSLYGMPDESVIMPAEDSREYEPLVLAAWSQQWPILRASFRFCTGSIAARSLAGRAFDLQVVPSATAREVRRELPNAAVVAPPWSQGKGPVPDWALLAATDLLGSDGGYFRAFLMRVARHLPGGREGFAPLAELYLFADRVASDEQPLLELLDFVALRYPAPADARGLKRALFGGRNPLVADLVHGTSERDILEAVATARSTEPFDPADLDLEERAQALWAADRSEGLRLVDHLAKNDHNALGERLLFALARSLGAEEGSRLIESAPPLAATVVRLNPGVATTPDLWHGSEERQRTLFDAATSGQETPADLRRGIVGAMLVAGSDAAAEAAGRRFGPDAILATLDWFDASGVRSPSQLPLRWRRLIGSDLGIAIDWLASMDSPREVSAALVADLTSPHSHEVQNRGPSAWLKTFRAVEEVDNGVAVRLRAFRLALGFDNTGIGSDELVATSFAVVHQALAEDRLGYEPWSWLEDRVPTLSWLRNWDRCERLRRGLVDRFAEFGWRAAQYVRCAADEEMLQAMLESCRKAKGGKALLRRLEEGLISGELVVGGELRRVLKRYT